MCTYVFAYYLRKNNQSLIFEANQKDLESATETLSEYLERDITSENLADIKQKVQDKYRYNWNPPFCSIRFESVALYLISPRLFSIPQILWKAAWSFIGSCSWRVRARLVVVHRLKPSTIQQEQHFFWWSLVMRSQTNPHRTQQKQTKNLGSVAHVFCPTSFFFIYRNRENVSV